MKLLINRSCKCCIIDLREGIAVARSNKSEQYIVCHYCHNSVCIGSLDLTMLCSNTIDIVRITHDKANLMQLIC